MQMSLVFNAIEMYEKNMALCACCQLITTIMDVLKLPDDVDQCTRNNLELWNGVFHGRKAYQPVS